MKKKVWIYCCKNDPRVFVYAKEDHPFMGAILNFAHRKSYWIMGGFIASLLLPVCTIFLCAAEKAFLAPLWGILWGGMVLAICLISAGRDLKRYPGTRSFRE